jgi:hypothetical protein
MWQMYAEDHAGVCLVFDRDALIRELAPQLEASGRSFHDPVKYLKGGIDEADRSATFFTLESPGGDAQEDVERHIERHRQALYFTKLADWESEWEYRFIVVGKDYDYLDCAIGDSLRAVVLGHEFPPWQGESVRKLCEEHGLALYRVHWEHWRPFLLKGPPRYQHG